MADVRLPSSCALILLVAGTAVAAGSSTQVAGAVASSSAGVRDLVREVSYEHGVDPRLIDALVRVESGYDPRAVSHRGALGLMQLMPETADRLGVVDPFDPEQNVRAGVREVARLIARYHGDLKLALAAYNAGEGSVARYRGVPPFAETRNYVTRILTMYTGRPYRLPAGPSARPVTMVTDPATGRTMITNQPAAGLPPTTGVARTGEESGPLRGGFGSAAP